MGYGMHRKWWKWKCTEWVKGKNEEGGKGDMRDAERQRDDKRDREWDRMNVFHVKQ